MLGSCNSEPEITTKPVFYHWGNYFELSNIEKINLAHLGSRKLYVRFFDVIWDNSRNEALPKGDLINLQGLKEYEVTPTIYLDPNIFNHLTTKQCKTFAELLAKRVSKMAEESGIKPKELNIDCNWKIQSQAGYFSFINQLKSVLNWNISCGITLVKLNLENFKAPPCSKVILQLYKQPTSSELGEKTFFDHSEMKPIAKKAAMYPRKMSLAFPLFSKAIHTRNKKALRTLPRATYSDFMHNESFDIDSPVIKVWEDTKLKNIIFKKNDLIYVEQASEKENYKFLELILQHGKGKKYEDLLFFDLDDRNIIHYDYSSIKKMTLLLSRYHERYN